jgi:hypothetical protein
MSKLSPTADHEDIDQDRKPSRFLSFLPYLLILIFTLVGVAYTSISKKPLILYWEILAVVTGGLCILSGWRHTHSRADRVRLIWTQVLHWGAFLAAMNLLLVSDVRRMLSTDATGLAVLLLLALGTFVAGVHSLSWQICALGLVTALSVPAIAWIEESALILLLAAIAFVVLGSLFWWLGHRTPARAELEGA